jgi:hypothetical protein
MKPTNDIILWEAPDGERHWEALEHGQMIGFLQKLLDKEGVHPATVMAARCPIFFHWLWPKYHRGLSDVHFGRINEEIYGSEPPKEIKRKPVDVPIYKEPVSKYGWLAPDGRFFHCDYGGHSNLADKIVGDMEYIPNPERHLEDKGWAKILSGGRSYGSQYTVGMGIDKKLTDKQLNTLIEMDLDKSWGVSFLL